VEIYREVELAARGRKTIIGARIEDVQPSANLGYFLSSIQWVDALPGPTEDRIDWLARTVAATVHGTEIVAEEPPMEPEFVEVDLDDFSRSGRRAAGFAKRLFEDRSK